MSNLQLLDVMKRKGQASGEYVVIIAVAVVFVLAIVVTAGAFLQDPAKKATVEQGGLIQSEISSLSKSLDKARVVTMRSPVAYRGFIDASLRMRFDVGTCLKNASLYSNESGVFEEVSVLSNLQNAPVGRLLTFDHVFREGDIRYNIRVCTCEDVCGWALQGPSPASGLPEGVFVSEFANREGNAQNGFDFAASVIAVPHGDYRYVEARDDFFDSNRPRGFRSLRVELLNAQVQLVNCNHGNCVYTANFTYNASGTYLKNATLKTLNANNELAEIQFSNFNPCAGAFVNNYSTRQVVDRQINYFERCLIAKDSASNDVNPLSTIENYNWTIELCNKYEKCKTARNSNNFVGVSFDDFRAQCSGQAQVTISYLFTPYGLDLSAAYINSTQLGDRTYQVRNLESGVQKVQNIIAVAIGGRQSVSGNLVANVTVCNSQNQCTVSFNKQIDVPNC